MKRTIIIPALFLITFSAFSQQFVCKQDTIQFYHNNYRGKMVWQTSVNGSDWTQLQGSRGDTIQVVANTPAYYRTEVTEGSCSPYYSDAVHLMINEPPVVTLNLRDSVCLNEAAFALTGGLPAKGFYWGEGVIDGKFMPSYAGAGNFKVFYSYRDSVTQCADTAFSFIRVEPLTNKAQAGIDIPFIAADSILLEANNPDNGIGTWTITEGSYGHFSNIHAPTSWFIKDSSHVNFTLKWSIAGHCGTSSDEVKITFFPLSRNPCPNTPIVTDADGNVYPTIQIGNQCWMAKNLNVGRFVNSTVNVAPHSNLSNNNIIEKYCYENKIENCNLYGGLYDWDEAMGYSLVENTQGICPTGWHIPGDSDWNTLTALFPTFTAGESLKQGKPSGFEALFVGNRHAMGEFYGFEASTFYWQSSVWADNTSDAFQREIDACNGNLYRLHFPKKTGLSIRCIKNN